MSNLRVVSFLILIIMVSGAPVAKDGLKEEAETGKEYIIKFKDNFDTDDSTDKISKHMTDFKLGSKLKWVYRKVFHGIAMQDVTRDALEWLQKQDYVQYVEESAVFSADNICSVPNNEAITQTDSFVNWGLDRITEETYSRTSFNFNPSARGYGATIYILDTGIQVNHEEFDGRASTLFVHFDSNFCGEHGTEVAGVAAGHKLGAANLALIESVQVLNCDGYGTTDTILAGLDHIEKYGSAKRNESVITMSFSADIHVEPLLEAITTMSSKGYIFVAAAGNGGTSQPQYPASYSQVLSVGAINAKGKLPCFSNFGPSVDIYAPGANIYVPTDLATNKIKKVSGTSFAAPFVSGVAAMMIQEILDGNLPEGTDIKARILSTAITSVTIPNLPSGSYNRILYYG